MADAGKDKDLSLHTLVCGAGPSEMAARVLAFDWSATPLGPAETWPESLRTAVGICLSSQLPMFVWWGPELINIYNDAYAPVLGKRHPDALGRRRLKSGRIFGRRSLRMLRASFSVAFRSCASACVS